MALRFCCLPRPAHLARDEKLKLAKREVVAAEKQLAQFRFMYEQYMKLWQQRQLTYLAQELQLYLKLIEITKLRVAGAKKVIGET